MDLGTVTSVVSARSRADLSILGADTQVLAGGTWLFSEPQDHLTTLVDLSTLDWPPLTFTADGLTVAATCTLAELAHADHAAAALFHQCCSALLASEKIWNTATVGGNLSLSLPAGAMVSLMAALDATLTVWEANGDDCEIGVVEFVTGVNANVMQSGDVLRSIAIPTDSLDSRTAFRKVALAPLGRSGSVVIGRLAPSGEFVVTITAATTRPVQLRFDALPTAADVAAKVAEIDVWFDDPHGKPDWRRHVSGVLAQQVLEELR